MLFTKIRNFNSKKVLAFILAICVTFSIVQSTMMLSLANSSEKQMLHLSDGLSKVGLELSGDKVTVGTEYIIEFKYHFESGNLYTTSAEAVSSPNAMFHVFYQATTEPTGGRMQYLVGPYGATKFTESNITETAAQFKFTINTASDLYYLGFLLDGAPDFYIADMVMYASNDANKTNILPEQTDSNWKYLIIPTAGSLYPLTHTHAANSGFELYNEEYFSEKKMLHLSDGLSKVGLELSGDKVTVGTEYIIEFKYHFESGNLYTTSAEAVSSPNAMFHVFYQATTEPTGGRMQYLVGPYGATKFTESNITETTAQFKFTINTVSDLYYLGFLLGGAPDFYIADMVMYASNDVNKTNILPEQTDSNWKYLITPTAGSVYPLTHTHAANSGFEPYDEETFDPQQQTPPAKQMLHFKSSDSNSQRSGIIVDKEELTAGKYTLSFKYKMVTGSLCYGTTDATDANYSAATNAVIITIYSHQGDKTNEMQYVKLPGVKSSYTYANPDSCTVEYTFDITDDDINACLDDFYIGFFIKGAPEFYVADMVMYKTSDANKTNILPANPTATDWKRGTYQSYYVGQLPVGSEYVDYIADYFVPQTVVKKQMLHFKSSDSNSQKSGIIVDKEDLTAGKYTLSFNYKMVTGSLCYGTTDATDANYSTATNAVVTTIYSHQGDKTKEMQYVVLPGVKGTYTYTNPDSCTVEYTFDISDDDINASLDDFYIGFFIKGAPEFYVADMVMYKTSDANKTNILPANPTATDWKRGTYQSYYVRQLPVGSAYVDYNDDYFVPDTPSGKRMLNFKYNAKTGVKVGDNTMEAGQYTVEFDYYFKEGTLQKVVDGMTDGALFAVFNQQYDQGVAKTVMMQYLIGYKTKFDKIVHIDTARMSYTFTITPAMLSSTTGDIRIGFLGTGTYDLYVANMTMYKTDDSNKTDLLPNVYNNSNWMYGSSIYGTVGLSAKNSILDYDETLFVHNVIPRDEQMLAIDVTHDWSSFLAHKFDKSILEPGVEYTASFKYHFVDGNLDKNVNFALFYTTANPRDSRVVDKVLRLSKEDTSMKLNTDFDTQYKDGANAKYTFTLDASEIQEAVSVFIGFSMGDKPKFYLYDLKLFKSKDATETNLLSIDNYNDNISVWWGLYGEGNEVYTRKYVKYDSSIFVPTSDENLYIDTTFNGDDGEWWNPKDIESTSLVETFTVKGIVTNQNGKPISNAKLLLKGTKTVYSTSSNDDGHYIFSNVPVGLYELYIIDGYDREIFTGFSHFFNADDTAIINITCDSSKAVFSDNIYSDTDVTYNPDEIDTGDVKGTLYNAEYKTVSGIKLYLRDFGEVITDEQGDFEFLDVPTGEYELYTVLADGSEHVFRTVNIKENVELGVKLKYPVSAQTDGTNNWIIWVIIAVGAILIVGGGTVAFIVIKRKKLQH